MSTEPVDPQLVEETKQQIRTLVSEINLLSKSDTTVAEFFNEFLNRLIQALGAIGGVIWLRNETGRIVIQYQINLRETQLGDSPEKQKRHDRLLQQVLAGDEGVVVPPHSGEGDDQEAGNPTDFLLLFGLLRCDKNVEGVVEIFQRPGASPKVQRGYLKFLAEMCDRADAFLVLRQLRQLADRQTLWGQLENFTKTVHQSLDPRETAYVIANEGRRLIDCDRVSVAVRKGRKCYVEAVSGQDVFDKRSNVISLLNRLATAVAASGDDVLYTGDTSNLAPQVEEAVQAYIDESHSKAVFVFPMRRLVVSESGEVNATASEAVGALIVEQIQDVRHREGMRTRMDVVCMHGSAALTNALDYHNLFLLPVWKALGKARWVMQARTLPKTIAVVAAVVAVIAALVFVPAELELKAEGALEPIVQHDVFAKIDGDVIKVLGRHGDNVKKGDVLVEMRSTKLNVEIEDLMGKIKHNQSEIEKTRKLINDRGTTNEQKAGLNYDIKGYEALRDSFQRKLELRLEEKEQLKIKSPMTGQITTSWDALENLPGRPVQRGQIVMNVADPQSDWELKVNMPEDRMGHIVKAQEQAGDKPLKVSYILATQPGVGFEGTVTEIHRRAEVRGEKGNTVLMRVAINKEELPQLRPGASVSVKVQCGKRSIGYVYLHDLFAWMQKFKFNWF